MMMTTDNFLNVTKVILTEVMQLLEDCQKKHAINTCF